MSPDSGTLPLPKPERGTARITPAPATSGTASPPAATPAAPPTPVTNSALEGHEFDWDRDKRDIVFESVRAVAVYKNPAGDLVIRQREPYDEGDDVVTIPHTYIEEFMMAIHNEVDP